jgi:hypothetical protein
LIPIIQEIQRLSILLAPLGQVFYRTNDNETWFSESYYEREIKYPVSYREPTEKGYSFRIVENKYFKDILGFEPTSDGFRTIYPTEVKDVKASGLFANLTHSRDAMLLRSVIEGVDLILPKHDDYITRLNEMHIVDDIIRRELINMGNTYVLSLGSIITWLKNQQSKISKEHRLYDYYSFLIKEIQKSINILKSYESQGKELKKIEGNRFISL